MISASEARKLVEETAKRKELLDEIEKEVRRAAYEEHTSTTMDIHREKWATSIVDILESYGYIVKAEHNAYPCEDWIELKITWGK